MNPLSVQNAITKLELSVVLVKVKSALGAYVWELGIGTISRKNREPPKRLP
jgi:hypothetical protein